MTVVLYSQPNCQPCRASKRLLDRLGVPYEEVDTSQDPEARRRLLEDGWQASPVIVAGDEAWSGYRADKIKALAEAS